MTDGDAKVKTAEAFSDTGGVSLTAAGAEVGVAVVVVLAAADKVLFC